MVQRFLDFSSEKCFKHLQVVFQNVINPSKIDAEPFSIQKTKVNSTRRGKLSAQYRHLEKFSNYFQPDISAKHFFFILRLKVRNNRKLSL